MQILETSKATSTESLASDMLTGAAEIAAFTGEPQRRVNYLLEKRRLPAFKVGNVWKMRKSTYMAHIERREAEALAGCAA